VDAGAKAGATDWDAVGINAGCGGCNTVLPAAGGPDQVWPGGCGRESPICRSCRPSTGAAGPLARAAVLAVALGAGNAGKGPAAALWFVGGGAFEPFGRGGAPPNNGSPPGRRMSPAQPSATRQQPQDTKVHQNGQDAQRRARLSLAGSFLPCACILTHLPRRLDWEGYLVRLRASPGVKSGFRTKSRDNLQWQLGVSR
jgi:hypothetical protein